MIITDEQRGEMKELDILVRDLKNPGYCFRTWKRWILYEVWRRPIEDLGRVFFYTAYDGVRKNQTMYRAYLFLLKIAK